MRRLLALLAAVLPIAVLPQEPASATAPTGFVVIASLGGGGELGLESGEDASVLELEGAIGYELSGGIRPELALTLGLSPDDHVAVRPGVRFALPNLPVHVRAALDAATSRDASGLDWRWLLVGVGGELRWTSLFGVYVEVDSGAPLASKAGVPLLVRAGTSLRF